MKLHQVSKWDEEFFTKFYRFKNYIHQNIPTSFPEELSDYSKFFSSKSVFKDDYSWVAFMVTENEKVLAKAILCWRTGTQNGNLGFIDWENDLEAASILIKGVKESATTHSLMTIKSPVDLNLFVKYRIRKPGGGKPFWGEPVYPDYYHDLFEKTGLKEVGRWDTYKINKMQAIIDYFVKRNMLAVKPSGSHNKTKNIDLRTTIRCVNMSDWNSELKTIYTLFHEAYMSMPEWEPISFEQFKVIYDDFKYIINPLYAYIIELKGEPVGFSINFADPLPILSKIKGKKLSKWERIFLFIRLRLNLSTLLIAHVGKISGPNGEEIKGVQIQVSWRIQFIAIIMRKVLVTYQRTNSPSRRSFNSFYQRPYAQYVLYGMDL